MNPALRKNSQEGLPSAEEHTPDVCQNEFQQVVWRLCWYRTNSIRDSQNVSTDASPKANQPSRTYYLSYALLLVSCLRLYALWSNGLASRFDVLISVCACNQVIVEILRSATTDTRLPHELVDLGTDDEHDSTRPDAETKPSTLKSVAAFLDNRKASVEVIAIGAILRVSWNPHDRCSALVGWVPYFAGCFAGTAQLYIRERMHPRDLTLEDWMICYVGMYIAFLA